MSLDDLYHRIRLLVKENLKLAGALAVCILVFIIVIIAIATVGSNQRPQKGILLIGGKGRSKIYPTVSIFHPSYSRLGQLPSLQIGRSKHLSAVGNQGNIMVFGGRQMTEALRSIEKYSPKESEWGNCSMISYPLYGAVGGTINQDFFMCGGVRTFHLHQYYKRCLVWNLAQNKWHFPQTTTSMIQERGHACSAVANSKLYVFGGFANGSNALDSMEVFSPDANEWHKGPRIPSALTHCAAASLGDTIYVCGGYPPPIGCYCFNTKMNKWTTIASMKKTRYNHKMVEFEGKLYSFMGNTATNLWSDTAEFYDPKTDKWTLMDMTFEQMEGFSTTILT